MSSPELSANALLLINDSVRFVRVIVLVVVSITLHELAHGWAALSQGDDTPRRSGHMTLNPVVHIGWTSLALLCIAGIAWGQMPVNPAKFRSAKWGSILVAAAGPLLNLGLGLGFMILLKLHNDFAFSKLLSHDFLFLAAHINLTLFLFNFLPIPPLDGFQVFSEFVPALKPLADDSSFGFFALFLLFATSGFGQTLSAIANWIIQIFTA